MRIAELFESSRKPIFSIEVYPPRTEKGVADLHALLPGLVELGPRYMTVTYGAMGTTQERTVEIATFIKREFEMETASHLTCVGASVAAIDGVLDRLGEGGIETIVALRGDPPSGEDHFVPAEGGFAHGNELVAHLRKRGDFGVAVAGYPEKHIEAPDLETDLRHLRRKVEAGADVIITQLFFDNADYFEFTRRVRELGIGVPVMPGILPVQSLSQVRKLTSLCGSKIPPALERELEAVEGDASAMVDVGVRWAVDQCRGLLEGGAPGIHFYVLNRAGAMKRIVPEIHDLLGRS